MKALVLFSGGLDSILAVKVLQEAGAEVEALHFLNPFHQKSTESQERLQKSIHQLNIPLHYITLTEDYFKIIENPAHGYGKRMNPCVDCRIYQLKLAKVKMKEIGASFLATGEVLDQRPNSQRRDAMDIVERDAGVRGILVRPLTAKHLRPTIPEIEGWIDRNQLLDIKGRGRTQQIELAAKFGIVDYPAPAGGCLLTYKEYAQKIADLLKYNSHLNHNDIDLLLLGRHLRLTPKIKLIIGKNEKENEMLAKMAKAKDYLVALKTFGSPTTLVIGPANDDDLKLAASITASYTKAPIDQEVLVGIETKDKSDIKEIYVKPMERERTRGYLITE